MMIIVNNNNNDGNINNDIMKYSLSSILIGMSSTGGSSDVPSVHTDRAGRQNSTESGSSPL